MKGRSLAAPIEAFCFADHKIALLSGPRQAGKTTLADAFLKRRKGGRYFNWDEFEFRRTWARNPRSLLPMTPGPDVPLVVLDEIHKDRLWKRTLKGLYDTRTSACDFLVTGSARLNVYRRGSDSLLGRFFHFRLHPFSLREMERADVLGPDDCLEALFSRATARDREAEGRLEALMTHGPFPEPLFRQDFRRTRAWRLAREQAVIREDLRDLSRLADLGRLELMAALLPERVGSLFSVANLREDMETGFDTIRRWMACLQEVYHLFVLKPYTPKIARSLRRQGKVYLWDYGAVRDDAARFENLVAHHLLKTCHYWTDAGEGIFDLHFLRNKEKQEIDFLIVRDGVPWLPVEVKMSSELSPNWRKFAPMLPCRRGLQIVRKPEWKFHDFGGSQVLVAGGAEALRYFA
jgi:hypothetical protein